MEAVSRKTITVDVNGERYERELDARRLLIHFIRDDLDLTGSHIGCDTGNCGACSVIVDGTLGPLSRAKHPALFWPVDPPERGQRRGEDHGFYLRRDHYEGAVGRAGNSVLVISQGQVVINIRRAEPTSATGARPT